MPSNQWDRLPFELFLSVLEHLPLNYVWRLRTVCKAWQHALSSQSAEELACRRHETHDKVVAPLAQRISILKAHYSGKPAGVLHTLEGFDEDHPAEPLLHGDRLAWRDNFSVMLMDLISGERSVFSAIFVKLMCLTSELLAYTTNSMIHIVPRLGMPFELPLPERLYIVHLAGDGSVLVLLGNSSEGAHLVVIRETIQQFPVRLRLPHMQSLVALLVEGLTCHVLCHWRVDDPEMEKYGKDCLRIVSVDLETGAQVSQDIWYEATRVQHSGNDIKARMIIRPAGLPRTYHVTIRPASYAPVPHDLLLTLGESKLEVVHNGDETIAIWKDKLYGSPRYSEIKQGSDTCLISVWKGSAQTGWFVAPGNNEYLDCRFLINEHYLVLLNTGANDVVFTFDETDNPTPLLMVDAEGESCPVYAWVDARLFEPVD